MSKIFTKPFRPLDWAATPHDFSGDNQLGPFAIEETQRYVYGTRYLMWDGRVYKYANAVSAVVSYHGCHAGEAAALAYTAPSADSAVAGDRFVVAAGTLGRSEDDLAGGYVVMYDSTIDDTVMRGIVGNDARTGTDTTIYLDYPLAAPVTTSDAIEVYENPYREVSHSFVESYGWLGVPATSAGAGYKLWVQTWGPALISGGEDLDSTGYRTLRWGTNAAMFLESNSANTQIAGYILQGSTATAGPLVMLMCST